MTEPVTISKAHFAALLRRYDRSTTQGCMKDSVSQLTLCKIRAKLVNLSQTRSCQLIMNLTSSKHTMESYDASSQTNAPPGFVLIRREEHDALVGLVVSIDVIYR